MSTAKDLIAKAENRTAVCGVVGLGYVGLPLAVELARSGYRVLGFDVNTSMVDKVNGGTSHVRDVSSETLTEFTADGLRRIAEIAWQVNEKTENIGARRLHTVMERLLEEASFGAADTGLQNETLLIDAQFVDRQLQELSEDEDLSRFIL